MEGLWGVFMINSVYNISRPLVSVIRRSKGRIFSSEYMGGGGVLDLDFVISLIALFCSLEIRFRFLLVVLYSYRLEGSKDMGKN